MEHLTDSLISELRQLIRDLGKDGGLISPSIYDTAQVMRFYPPPEGTEPALAWLLSQQQADGGWGDPAVPLARDVPTMAAVLAIQECAPGAAQKSVIEAALQFLRAHGEAWEGMRIDALPIAAEMIIPRLIEELTAHGCQVDPAPYAALTKLRTFKLSKLAVYTFIPGTAPTYSWEAYNGNYRQIMPDASGGIGHSPAATAAWLSQAQHGVVDGASELGAAFVQAESYLRRASQATLTDIPGVVPNVWPISGFELSYGPYAIHTAGLAKHPAIQDELTVVNQKLLDLLTVQEGISFGQRFVPDVDCTAVGITALSSVYEDIPTRYLTRFQQGDCFYTYENELNPSVFSNAHAVQALNRLGRQFPATEKFLFSRRNSAQVWDADKWHSSWRYTTLEVLSALSELEHDDLSASYRSLLAAQGATGEWGLSRSTRVSDTAYTMLALGLRSGGAGSESRAAIASAIRRAAEWMQSVGLQQSHSTRGKPWLGKELYSPYRVERIYHLAATLAFS